jgi:hypothetical protein
MHRPSSVRQQIQAPLACGQLLDPEAISATGKPTVARQRTDSDRS